MDRKVLSVRHYKTGYEVRTEDVTHNGMPPVRMKSAYTPSGDYIGNSIWGHRLVTKRGIAPEKSDPDHVVCSIGFCESDQKWYGWSHRAIFGFRIGFVVEKGSACASSGWTEEHLKEHPEDDKSLPIGFEVKTLEDARKAAVAFAASVS